MTSDGDTDADDDDERASMVLVDKNDLLSTMKHILELLEGLLYKTM